MKSLSLASGRGRFTVAVNTENWYRKEADLWA
jgi:hypothetical protein